MQDAAQDRDLRAPGDWHAFWGEVSTLNDDETDNFFREEIGRCAAIEEVAHPLHLLVSDYALRLS